MQVSIQNGVSYWFRAFGAVDEVEVCVLSVSLQATIRIKRAAYIVFFILYLH
jgi:hypothetical protein